MAPLFLLRLVLDFVAVGLFLGAMAYWWLDNRTHELVGTAMFALLFLHNAFNRRWYGGLTKTRRQPRPLVTVFLNLTLLATMVSLLTTSVLISQTLFSGLAIGGSTARDIHILAAYWAMLIIAIHIGMHWYLIMGVAARLSGIREPSLLRSSALRALSFAAAIYGACVFHQLDIGSRLLLIPTMQFWDFNEDTVGFFVRHAALIALFACLGHYGSVLLQGSRRPSNIRQNARKEPI